MKNKEENQLITIALARVGGDRVKAAEELGMSIRTLQRKIKARVKGGDLVAVDFLERLIERARSYGHQGDYVCVRDFVRWCHEEYDERPPTDEELEPFTYENDEENKCKGCGFVIADGASLCGECACEDDCRPD